MAKIKSITDELKLKENSDSLRKLAEAKILKSEIEQKDLNVEEIKEILHELQVQQIELDIQNEELRQSHLALDESLEKYFTLYNFAPVGYITLNEKGLITLSNLTATNLFGITKTELLNTPFSNYIFREDQDVYYLNRKRLMETNVKQQFEIRIKNSDGTNFWANVDAVLSVKEDDDLKVLISIADISKLKAEEELLRNSEIHLQETQAIARLGNYSMDIVNDEWTSSVVLDEIFGIDSDYEKTAKAWAAIIHPDWQEMMYNYFIQEVVGKGIRFDKEYKIVRLKDKAERWVHGTGGLKFNEKNQPVIMIGTIQDITEQKQAEEIIELKNKQLEKTIAEKDRFFSIVAHDLRSPFTGFLGFTELLKTGVSDLSINELQEIANRMNSSANNLFGLLTNLLEWAKMQRGITIFNPGKLSAKNIINGITEILKEASGKKGIEIIEKVEDNLFLTADEAMLKTILRNLITNAIKFTNAGGRITVSANASDDGTTISVKDTGIGMGNDLINDLFKIDTKTNRKGTDGELSSGLGLLLCKEFIDKHNGNISVFSEEGKGSEFIIRLPI